MYALNVYLPLLLLLQFITYNSYRPAVPTEFVLRQLNLATDVAAGLNFLIQCGAVLIADGQKVDCKASVISTAGLVSDKPNSLL
jgi:hypothetical protein